MSNEKKYPIFGAKLRWARAMKDISQQQLADKIGRTRAAVGSWEEGRSRPGRKVLLTIASALEVPVDIFYIDDQDAIGSGTPSVAKQDKPQTEHDAEGITPNPQIPGIYQSIIAELIESSRAQRRISEDMGRVSMGIQKISEVLLEERQMIRDTAQAAIDMVKQAKDVPAVDLATKKDAANIQSSLNMINVQLKHTNLAIQKLEDFSVSKFAQVLNRPLEDIAGQLSMTPTRADNSSGKLKRVDN